MKLITEQLTDVSTLYEAANNDGKKNLFIEGIFLQSETKNRNGRIYPKNIMEKEVRRYMKEAVQRGNAFGELDHPPAPKINPDRISHLITSLREDGNNYIGKAKILETPMGIIARNIIEGGGQLAVSSRGVGSLKRHGDAMMVQEDFMLSTAADIVINPSAPLAYVDAIMESPDWIYDHVTGEWALQEAMREIHSTKPSTLNESDALRILNKWASSFDISKFL